MANIVATEAPTTEALATASREAVVNIRWIPPNRASIFNAAVDKAFKISVLIGHTNSQRAQGIFEDFKVR